MTKNFWHDIESGIDIPEIINVIVENPQGIDEQVRIRQKAQPDKA